MTLTAGAAARSITPDRPVPLFGYPHCRRISSGVHDPIWASALYLADGDRAVVLVSLDLLFVAPPVARRMRRAAAAAAGIDEACVLISCTHTHSGPVSARILAWQDDPTASAPDPDYLDWVQQQIAAAAGQAAAAARPAAMAWTTADARGVGGNRQRSGGPTDPEASLLAVRDAASRKLAAVVLVYGMHPTVLHEDSTLVSSDFPHYARQELVERFGDQLTVLYHMAPSGDQSPRRFVQSQTFAEAERLGRELGRAAAERLDALADADFQSTATLDARVAEVELPRRPIPLVAEAERLLDACRREHQRLIDGEAPRAEIRTAECGVFGGEGTLTLARAAQRGELDRVLADYQPAVVQVLRLGDASIVGLPGEVFSQYALEIKRRSPMATAVVSLANGELQGYVVTDEAAAEGGYEATTAMFAPTAGPILVECALELIDRLTHPTEGCLP